MFDWISSGIPDALKMDNCTLLAETDLRAFAKPGMRHTIGELETAAAEGNDRVIRSKPSGCNIINGTTALEMFKFEQVVPAAELPLKLEKRRPVTETIVKATPTGMMNATLKVTFWRKFSGAWRACWLKISDSLKARS